MSVPSSFRPLRLIALIAFGVLAFSAIATASPPGGGIMIYLWDSPQAGTPDQQAAALAGAGFSVVSWDPAQLDVLARYGLQGMVHADDPATVAAVRSNPNLWGYFLADEPFPQTQFAPLAQTVSTLRASDPSHPAFINVLSTTGEFLSAYLSSVHPALLSFDFYQWQWGQTDYLGKLTQFRQAALLAGIPLMVAVEVVADPHGLRLADNALKIRESVYSDLAFGAKGIEWYNADSLFLKNSLALTQAGIDVAALNREITKIGVALEPLKTVDCFVSGPGAPGTQSVPDDYWLQTRTASPEDAGLIEGMLTDSAGVDYALIVNRSVSAAEQVAVQLRPQLNWLPPWDQYPNTSYSVEAFEKATSAWTPLIQVKAGGSLSLTLLPAGAELLRITTTTAPVSATPQEQPIR